VLAFGRLLAIALGVALLAVWAGGNSNALRGFAFVVAAVGVLYALGAVLPLGPTRLTTGTVIAVLAVLSLLVLLAASNLPSSLLTAPKWLAVARFSKGWGRVAADAFLILALYKVFRYVLIGPLLEDAAPSGPRTR
jgi:hypothetical protein